MRVIAIDFDDCACAYSDKVNRLYDDRLNFIVIYTARPEYLREVTTQQLDEKRIKYHALVMGKLRADIYIDDRNCGGLKWPEES